jgi:hypothetical protein
MNFLLRVAFVFGAIFLGVNLVNYFVLDQTADYLPGGDRMASGSRPEYAKPVFPRSNIRSATGNCRRCRTENIASNG